MLRQAITLLTQNIQHVNLQTVSQQLMTGLIVFIYLFTSSYNILAQYYVGIIELCACAARFVDPRNHVEMSYRNSGGGDIANENVLRLMRLRFVLLIYTFWSISFLSFQ